eukprot:14269376-Alexandrium_andersonii.AAC.1
MLVAPVFQTPVAVVQLFTPFVRFPVLACQLQVARLRSLAADRSRIRFLMLVLGAKMIASIGGPLRDNN